MCGIFSTMICWAKLEFTHSCLLLQLDNKHPLLLQFANAETVPVCFSQRATRDSNEFVNEFSLNSITLKNDIKVNNYNERNMNSILKLEKSKVSLKFIRYN